MTHVFNCLIPIPIYFQSMKSFWYLQETVLTAPSICAKYIQVTYVATPTKVHHEDYALGFILDTWFYLLANVSVLL